MTSKIIKTSASIVIGATTSNPIVLNEMTPVALMTSASVVTGTAITFLVSTDGNTYVPLYDETSTEVSLTNTTAARAWSLPVKNFLGWTFMKVRLGTSASAKAQATYDAPISLLLEQW
jgi:hypothetical protein